MPESGPCALWPLSGHSEGLLWVEQRATGGTMRRLLLASALLVMGAVVQGCERPGPPSINFIGVMSDRPLTSIGPSWSTGPGPWRMYEIILDRGLVSRSITLGSTFRIRLFDCDHGKEIRADDVYVRGRSLNISEMSAESLEAGSAVKGVFYVSTDEYRPGGDTCARVEGGSMVGWRFRSSSAIVP